MPSEITLKMCEKEEYAPLSAILTSLRRIFFLKLDFYLQTVVLHTIRNYQINPTVIQVQLHTSQKQQNTNKKYLQNNN